MQYGNFNVWAGAITSHSCRKTSGRLLYSVMMPTVFGVSDLLDLRHRLEGASQSIQMQRENVANAMIRTRSDCCCRENRCHRGNLPRWLQLEQPLEHFFSGLTWVESALSKNLERA
jgi:hypothetical protein